MRALGCDIGNARAYVSIVDGASGSPKCVLPPEQELGGGMPTKAYVHVDGTIEVDPSAVSHGDPGLVVRNVTSSLAKRTLHLAAGDGSRITVGAQDVYAVVAQKALDAATTNMASQGIAPTRNVVLTYPVSFRGNRSLIATMRAAVSHLQAPDGMHYVVVDSIPEPAAIALDFLHFMRHEVALRRRVSESAVNMIVYDLGHESFDATLVTVREPLPGESGGMWKIHGSKSLEGIGGAAFDKALAELIRSRLGLGVARGGSAWDQRLLSLAAQAKHQLSVAEQTSVDVELPDGSHKHVLITRSEFEAVTGHLLDETIKALDEMLDTAQGLGLSVTHIGLSGGSSKMPMVRARVMQHVDYDVLVNMWRPLEAVSFGAARHAQTLAGKIQPDETVPVDVLTTAEDQMDQLFDPLFPNEPEQDSSSAPDSNPDPNPDPDPEPEPDPDPEPIPTLDEVPYPLGILYPGRRGRMLQVLLPKGAVIGRASERNQMEIYAESSRVDLVVARAIDPLSTKRRMREDAFQEVCHIVSDRAIPGTIYNVLIGLEKDGRVFGLLISGDGRDIRLEMS